MLYETVQYFKCHYFLIFIRSKAINFFSGLLNWSVYPIVYWLKTVLFVLFHNLLISAWIFPLSLAEVLDECKKYMNIWKNDTSWGGGRGIRDSRACWSRKFSTFWSNYKPVKLKMVPRVHLPPRACENAAPKCNNTSGYITLHTLCISVFWCTFCPQPRWGGGGGVGSSPSYPRHAGSTALAHTCTYIESREIFARDA